MAMIDAVDQDNWIQVKRTLSGNQMDILQGQNVDGGCVLRSVIVSGESTASQSMVYLDKHRVMPNGTIQKDF